ncbi:MAG: thiol peroxidase [Chlamydiae bacterium]|nr:thiol peroxidase [Chlamydiota bacterium]
MMTVTLHGKPFALRGVLPQVGKKVQDFLLIDSQLQEKHLSDFSKKKLVVVVPSLDTEVCSLSSKKFSDQVKTKDIDFLIISADLPFAQKRYCGAQGVPNATTLSMMRDKSFAEDFGVLIAEGPLQGLCARAVFVLDKDNTLLYAELVREISQEPSYDQALTYL